MAGVLNLVYSVAVLLVTVGGLAFVLWSTSDGAEDDGIDWSSVAVVVVVAAFLAVMVGELVVATP